MRPRSTGIVLLVAAFALLVPVVARAHGNPNPGVTPLSREYREFAEQWLEWASQPPALNPLADLTGAMAANGQPRGDDVFFLGGVFYNGDPNTPVNSAQRTVTISEGKRLFFPVINWFWLNWDDYARPPHKQLTGPPTWPNYDADGNVLWFDTLKQYIDYMVAIIDGLMISNADGMYATIDGRPVQQLTRYRATSAGFNINVSKGNWWSPSPPPGLPAVWGTIGPNVIDGYWLLLEPLEEGHHVIQFGHAGWGMHIRYDITVTDRDRHHGGHDREHGHDI